MASEPGDALIGYTNGRKEGEKGENSGDAGGIRNLAAT